MIFSDEDEAREWVANREYDEGLGGIDPVLSGANWALISDQETLLRVKQTMAGWFTQGPEEPPFSKAEMAYLEAIDHDPDDAYSQDQLDDAREECGYIGDYDSTISRALYMLEGGEDTYWDVDDFAKAVPHLCPKYEKALNLAKRGFTDGTYVVGDDIKPGTYRTGRIYDSCYWSRTSDHGKILANDFITNAPKGARVTIRKSDGGFESSGCGAWVPAE